MPKIKNVALLDIGSSKIELVYGYSNDDSTDIVATFSHSYSGFANGAFFEEDKLNDIVLDLLRQLEKRIGKSLKKLYVAVPGEFTMVEVRKLTDRFDKPKSVSRTDINKLLEQAKISSDTNEYININTSLIGFDADSYRPIDSKNTSEVITRSVNATISCVMCARNFIDVFDNILKLTSIKEVKYMSSSFAESLYLTSAKEREKGVILCDIGYLTTSVMLARGEGLADMRSFSMGGAHIVADYTMAYNIDFASAENLYKKVNLKIEPRGYEDYHVNSTQGLLKFPMNDINSITFDRLDIIIGYIKKCLQSFDHVGQFMPIYFTGGGIMACKGAIEYIAYNIGRKYDIRVPNVVKYNYPWCSSMVAGLALASHIEVETSGFKKLFNKLFGGLKNG